MRRKQQTKHIENVSYRHHANQLYHVAMGICLRTLIFCHKKVATIFGAVGNATYHLYGSSKILLSIQFLFNPGME